MRENTEVFGINEFKMYPVGIVRKYFDLIYGVNAVELSIMQIIQIIDLMYNCGYTDEQEYPLQFRHDGVRL